MAHDGSGLDDDSIAVFSRTDRVNLEDTIALCGAQSRQDLEGSFRYTQLELAEMNNVRRSKASHFHLLSFLPDKMTLRLLYALPSCMIICS